MEENQIKKIKEHVEKINIIDTHEHLPPEAERLMKNDDVFSLFFSHYASSDLLSAGMTKEDLHKIRNPEIPIQDRWEKFEPWWELISNTGYAKALKIAAKDLYGLDDLTEDTYIELSKRIVERNKKGIYHWILKERAGIEVSINDTLYYDVDRTLFAPVRRFNEFLYLRDRKSLEALGNQVGGSIHTFQKLLKALESEFKRTEGKIIGVKIGLAYSRSIRFEKISFAEAEKVFNRIYNIGNFRFNEIPRGYEPDPLETEEYQLLQDYLIHKIIQEAINRQLPIQIHTGLQEGNENILKNSHPEHLTNLFMEYKEAKFDIFHGSWPYTGELAALAKNFPNVYIDMSWMHIISPSNSRTALNHWLDEVPANKIMGFGGDYLFPEGAYGHSVIARENIAKVLSKKVQEGEYSIEQAKKYSNWLLRENPIRLFFPRYKSNVK
jgi:hypothetical protein